MAEKRGKLVIESVKCDTYRHANNNLQVLVLVI